MSGETNVWPNVSSDVYQVTGTASGTASDSHKFTATIISTLLLNMACEWKFESGQVTVTPDVGPSMTIDFGSGTCTGQATIEIAGLPNITVNL